MRIINKVEKIVTKNELVGIICNKCGNLFSPHDDKIQPLNTPLGDYGDCKFELCDDCSLEIIKTFAIVPENFMSDSNFISSFDLDHELHQQLFDEWKSSGKWNCDENPWRDYYNEDNSSQEYEEYEEYYEGNKNIETRKPLHSSVLKLVE